MAKQPISIEKLLSWTYRHELPKKEIGGLTGWEASIFLLGTRIDNSREPDEPGFPVAMGAPHPDALLVDWRVRQLGTVVVLWEVVHQWIMGSLAGTSADDIALRRMQFERSALIQLHARMGTRPQWDPGEVTVCAMRGRNGKPVVVGLTPGGRYAEGSYCPLEIVPSLREIAHDRVEWFVWHETLLELAHESWNLADWEVLPSTAAAQPWVFDDEKKSRILRDISQGELAKSTSRKNNLTKGGC